MKATTVLIPRYYVRSAAYGWSRDHDDDHYQEFVKWLDGHRERKKKLVLVIPESGSRVTGPLEITKVCHEQGFRVVKIWRLNKRNQIRILCPPSKLPSPFEGLTFSGDQVVATA